MEEVAISLMFILILSKFDKLIDSAKSMSVLKGLWHHLQFVHFSYPLELL
jgi:hypothetical protein